MGERLAIALKPARQAIVVGLTGQLGAGKTTLVRGMAHGFGITTRLLSPTYTIVRRYPVTAMFSWLYHLDLYRIQHVREIYEIGFDEIIADPSHVVVVEWIDRIAITPTVAIHLELAATGHRIQLPDAII